MLLLEISYYSYLELSKGIKEIGTSESRKGIKQMLKVGFFAFIKLYLNVSAK